ncbi:MAG: formate dehydrogenase [Rhizobacter sp.]|nr:formate dehydrogenase [Rhizobacter sp.]
MKTADALQVPGRRTGLTNRRSLMAGAGIAATAAVAMKALPGAVPAAAAPALAKAAPDTRGGYQLTAHVRRYYETTQA